MRGGMIEMAVGMKRLVVLSCTKRSGGSLRTFWAAVMSPVIMSIWSSLARARVMLAQLRSIPPLRKRVMRKACDCLDIGDMGFNDGEDLFGAVVAGSVPPTLVGGGGDLARELGVVK